MKLAKLAKSLIKNQRDGVYPSQKTPEWYTSRKNKLTASDCATALDCNPYESKRDLLIKKISCVLENKNSNRSNSNMDWGNKYEPIAQQFYEKLVGEKIHNIGLVTHNTHSWLGASPDGLSNKGKLLEIKCPVNRKIGDIPHYYWIQVQIQLEVCGLHQCDFLECQFEECTKEDYVLIQSDNKGQIAESGVIKYWYMKKYSLQTIKKDQGWFVKNIDDLKIFWDNILYYRKTGHQQLHVDTKRFASLRSFCGLKRKSNEIEFTPSHPSQPSQPSFCKNILQKKRQKTNTKIIPDEYIDWNKWIAATKTRNYIIEDPLIDWLEYHGNHLVVKSPSNQDVYKIPNELQTSEFDPVNSSRVAQTRASYDVGTEFSADLKNSMLFTQFLKENGSKFEKYVMKELMYKFSDNIFIAANPYQSRSFKKFQDTIEAMNRGVPIIYHGVLRNNNNNTYGMPDLIVRSDWINKIFNDPVISETSAKEKARNLNVPEGESWHYRIMDIKFSTLALRADGKHLLKNNSTEAMKSQLYIYSMALSNIQGYCSPKAYIIGRKWHYRKGGVVYSGDCWFDRVGHVNYKNVDFEIREKTRLSLLWVHKVRRYGHTFKLNPPSCPELYPNMCNNLDGPWGRVKAKIAKEIQEITSLWNCGPKNRRVAHSNGILGWNDPKCCSENLGVTGSRVAPTLQQIIDVNQTSELTFLLDKSFDKNELCDMSNVIRENIEILIPKSIKSDTLRNWIKKKKIEIKKGVAFVDFETITDLTLDEEIKGSSFIFMIGIGFISKKKWNYECFYVNELTKVEECRIMIEFHTLIAELNPSYLLHWSHAEKTFYNTAWKKHKLNGFDKIDIWGDMLKVFRDEPITIKGALNFSLKSIAKAFYKHGFIKTIWPNTVISDGMAAMIQAYDCYKTAKKNNINDIMVLQIMKDIKKYNEVDCKVLWEILSYLVKHYVNI